MPAASEDVDPEALAEEFGVAVDRFEVDHGEQSP
jgi:hypothetical protein